VDDGVRKRMRGCTHFATLPDAYKRINYEDVIKMVSIKCVFKH